MNGKQLDALGVYADLAKKLVDAGQGMEQQYGRLQTFLEAGEDNPEVPAII